MLPARPAAGGRTADAAQLAHGGAPFDGGTFLKYGLTSVTQAAAATTVTMMTWKPSPMQVSHDTPARRSP